MTDMALSLEKLHKIAPSTHNSPTSLFLIPINFEALFLLLGCFNPIPGKFSSTRMPCFQFCKCTFLDSAKLYSFLIPFISVKTLFILSNCDDFFIFLFFIYNLFNKTVSIHSFTPGTLSSTSVLCLHLVMKLFNLYKIVSIILNCVKFYSFF